VINIAGDRNVEVATEVLNKTLCTIDAVLPDAPAAGVEIAFSDGGTGQDIPSGQFVIGDNPVIDVTIPADIVSGFLLVTVLDVSGIVFHLLPNVNRPDNRIEDLRDGRSGPITIRVAYTLDESKAAGGAKIAFLVDENGLGKSRILVLHTQTDILDGLRPTTESAESLSKALEDRQGAIRSLDSRILLTSKP